MTEIYYCTVRIKVQYTQFEYSQTYYFNSAEAQKHWIKKFRENSLSLEKIISKGKAYFNDFGILNP